MIVHNGAPWIVAKQANLLALDYPPEALRINIVCAGCDDSTEALLRATADPRVRVFAFAERRGKSACIGHMMPALDRDLVLFTDVRQRLDSGAGRALSGDRKRVV